MSSTITRTCTPRFTARLQFLDELRADALRLENKLQSVTLRCADLMAASMASIASSLCNGVTWLPIVKPKRDSFRGKWRGCATRATPARIPTD